MCANMCVMTSILVIAVCVLLGATATWAFARTLGSSTPTTRIAYRRGK